MKKIFYIIAIIICNIQLANAQLPKNKFNVIKRIGNRNEIAERNALLKKNNPNEVWFYEHANYQGKKYILSKGKFALSNLGATANDFFSSAIIPQHLTVKIFFDDELNGKWIMLKPDEMNTAYNNDFSNLQTYQYGQDENSVAIHGSINANDLISSIEIFSAAEDYIELYDDCNYKSFFMRLNPTPPAVANSIYLANFRKNGWADIVWMHTSKKPTVSSIAFHGNIASVDISLQVDFAKPIKKGIYQNLDCLTKFEYVDPFRIDDHLTYNDKVRSIRINLKYGFKTIEE